MSESINAELVSTIKALLQESGVGGTELERFMYNQHPNATESQRNAMKLVGDIQRREQYINEDSVKLSQIFETKMVNGHLTIVSTERKISEPELDNVRILNNAHLLINQMNELVQFICRHHKDNPSAMDLCDRAIDLIETFKTNNILVDDRNSDDLIDTLTAHGLLKDTRNDVKI